MPIDNQPEKWYNEYNESEVMQMLRNIIIALSILLMVGVAQNPNNLYVATDFNMVAIDESHLKAYNGEIYEVQGGLSVGETYAVKLEFHPDRTEVVQYTEKG